MKTYGNIEISLDSGDPFIIWDKERPNELKKGAVIDTLLCDNPSCRLIHIVGMYIDERFQDITMTGGKLSYQLAEGSSELIPDPLLRTSFSVDIDTHKVELSKESSKVANDPELFSWLSIEIVSEEYLQFLKRRWRILKGENDDQWREEDWAWWSPGDKIPFLKAFPDSFSFSISYDNQQFVVQDYYCVTPGCQCQDISLIISNYDEKYIEAGGVVNIDGSTLEVLEFEPKSISRDILENIWRKFRLKKKLKSTLQERRRKMQTVGKELFKMRDVDLQMQPEVSVKKIGRNQPCPCGSGKKYKKCCL